MKWIFFGIVLLAISEGSAEEHEADLLVVGGTESGCAAAVQAARMGVERIVLVNDIEWLGGQFSAEGLGAIDENRAHGYDGSVPIPRSGIFREVIDAIEDNNATLCGGVRRPGNTRVITTSRPVHSEEVFRQLLAPYEESGQIVRHSNRSVKSVLMDGRKVIGVEFSGGLTIRARMTIDASDWGDVVKGSGARWDAGLDAKSEFGEPSAPESGEPSTDLNPITWCMILEQQNEETLFPKPQGYDPRYFTGKWGWIDEEFAYTTRRLIDGMGMDEIDHPDILLINNPSIDYPLDVWPDHVAADLEEHAAGASKKSLVEMTPVEREIVFADARAHTLKYYYHLQQKFPKFRRMGLSKEFGTADHLPPKPYIRESLRMVAEHIVKEQEVLGFESRSNYATTMFPDAVFGWQFELDFHPTKRSFVTDEGSAGPWEADFRGARRFGRGGTGRAVFPLRALIPADVDGLLGAQKNLGYTSIVSSSCRLHDQSIHVGQAAGAAAAVSLRHDVDPSTFIDEPDRLSEIWAGLLEVEDGAGLAIWPFSDVDPHDPDFAAIQHLALRRCLPLDQSDTAFQPDEVATPEWIAAAVKATKDAGYNPPSIIITRTERRRLIANRIWKHISKQPTKPLVVREWKRDPKTDGLPEDGAWDLAINFTAPKEESAEGFLNNHGSRDSGWGRDLSKNNRFRNSDGHPLRDGFVFTRQKDVWTTEIENGTWQVVICLGDSGHEQPGQFLRIQDELVAEDVHTAAGRFLEVHAEVQVTNRQLRVTLGREEGGSNTCINWLVAKRLTENE